MNQTNTSDEIQIKNLIKKVILIYNKKRKKIYSLLGLIILLCSIYFFRVMLAPKYRTEVILKSKYIKIDQLNACVNNLNLSIEDPKDEIYYELFKKFNVLKIGISELNPDPRDKEEKFRLYLLKLIHSKAQIKGNEQILDTIVYVMQQKFAVENEISENIKILKFSIADIDSLIQIAFKAGRGIESHLGTSNQTFLMSDIYKGIKDIIQQREGYQKQLSFYDTSNLVFKSSPSVQSKNFKFPFIIFLVGLGVWSFIVAVWIGFSTIMNEES